MLGILAAEETASSADAQLVGTVFDEALNDVEDIATFDSTSVPDWAIQGMLDLVAGRAAPYFGQPRGNDDIARGTLAAAKHRKFGSPDTLSVEYF